MILAVLDQQGQQRLGGGHEAVGLAGHMGGDQIPALALELVVPPALDQLLHEQLAQRLLLPRLDHPLVHQRRRLEGLQVLLLRRRRLCRRHRRRRRP